MKLTKGFALGGLILAFGVLTAPVAAQEQAPPPDAKQVEEGKKIFTGKGMCHVCHGPDGKGGPLAPSLTDDVWLHIDGKWESIIGLVKTGVPQPKEAPAPMPAMGGASLKDAEVTAVAAYVYSLSHPPVK